MSMTREEMAELLEEKLQKLEEKLEEQLEEQLEKKLEKKLQPIWQAMNSMNGRVSALDGKVATLVEDVRQIKFDSSKLRTRLNRVDLEDLRADVDAIKLSLGLE